MRPFPSAITLTLTPHPKSDDNELTVAGLSIEVIAVAVVVVVVLIGIVVLVCICIKKHTRKETPAPRASVVAMNPYHLGEFGLTNFVKEDKLRTEGSLEKGFESSNFRVVKDALTKRVVAFGGVQMPVRYITTAIKGLIKHHTGSSQHQQFENLMVETEIAMAQTNEHGAGVMAEMFWSSSLSIQGTELCSILNAAIRQDHPDNIVYAGNVTPDPSPNPNASPVTVTATVTVTLTLTLNQKT